MILNCQELSVGVLHDPRLSRTTRWRYFTILGLKIQEPFVDVIQVVRIFLSVEFRALNPPSINPPLLKKSQIWPKSWILGIWWSLASGRLRRRKKCYFACIFIRKMQSKPLIFPRLRRASFIIYRTSCAVGAGKNPFSVVFLRVK